MSGAGQKIEGQLLYEKNKHQESVLPAPMIVADALRTPENMGGVLRVAEAVGSSKVLFIEDDGHELSSVKKIQKAARHADQSVPWDYCSRDIFCGSQGDVPLIALELTDTSTNVFETELPRLCAFVVGNERFGISESILSSCQQAVHIPMYGRNGSMNVSHALAIVLYEWRRQMENRS
ncbi:MAG: TrmH family RNA methyltransferase [Mariprofundaceae bacterium]